MTTNHKRYKEIIDPLVAYSCDVFNDMTSDKLFLVRLIYETMRESIADLHQTRIKKLRTQAREYFSSESFVYHCRCVGIKPVVMLRIAMNPEKYLDKIEYYKEEVSCESSF